MEKIAHDAGDPQLASHCPFCFTGNTRFITHNGIRSFEDTVGTTQEVLTADDNEREKARWVKAKIRCFGKQHVMRVTLKRNKRTMIIEATPEHRWLVKSNRQARPKVARISRKGKPRDWRPTECVRGHKLEGDNVRINKNGTRNCKLCAKTAIPLGGTSRAFNTDVLTRDLTPGMRLSSLRPSGISADVVLDEEGARHGIVFGDGSASGLYASINLWGEKDKQLLKFFPDRRYKDVNTADRVIGTGVPGVRVSGNLWAWMKSMPTSEDDSYLYGWLAGYMAADGTVSKQGQVSLSSANLEHLEKARDIALRLGISTYGITVGMRRGFPGREPSALYDMEFVTSTLREDFFLIEQHRDRWALRSYEYERFGWTVVSVEDTGRIETVYCAVVPETHSFALEGNIWVGNCGSGQIFGRSDGNIACQFCGQSYLIRVQPVFSGMPQQADPGFGGMSSDAPDLMDPAMLPPGEEDPAMMEEGAPPFGKEGEEPPPGDEEDEGAPPFATDDGDDDGSDDEGDGKKKPPPFAKKSSLFQTIAGDWIPREPYVRHLAALHWGVEAIRR